MRKLIGALALVVALAGTIAAGGAVALAQDEQPQRGGRLELVALNDLATLDNTQALDLDYNMVAGALYEGLYHFDPQGELEPGLADGLPEVSEDGLVYTFRIKPGAMFAGPDFEPREVTAADVAYGMLRGLDPEPVGAPIQGWGASYLFPIKGAAAFAAGEGETVEGIEVIDDHTLQVTLEQPTSTFLLGLTIATSWPVPQEAVEERGEDFANRPVGAGPFFVQQWNKGSDITIARNPGYVDPDLPYLDEIRVDLGVDENTQVLRLESGEADGVFEQFAISPPALRLLHFDDSTWVNTTTSNDTSAFVICGQVTSLSPFVVAQAPPAAMPILDTFDRPDGALGGNWAGATAQFFYAITGARLDVGAGGFVYWNPTAFGSSQTASVTLSSVDPKSPSQGLLLKVQGGALTNTGAIAVVYDALAREVRVSTLRPGVAWTPYRGTSATLRSRDRLAAWVTATGEVGILRNDALLTTVTLTASDQAFFNQRGGKLGLWTLLAPNSVFDDFGGGALTR